jgi:hypothetical protein
MRPFSLSLLLLFLFALPLVNPADAIYPAHGFNNNVVNPPQAEKRQQSDITLVINEFLASNDDSLQDPQGQYDDWIEIYNYGPEAIDLEGMYLTDDLSEPTKSRIYSDTRGATIARPDDYLIVWADGDTSSPGLHANFRLSAAGEEIGLFDADGTTLIDSVIFLDQTTDISYGRFPDADDLWRCFAAPTPGRENNEEYGGFVGDPRFSHDSGFYTAPVFVTIATETKDALIYYTLDGSEPYDTSGRGRGPGGTLYTHPITITATTHLRAKAVKPGCKPSNVRTRAFIFLDPDIRNFSSNLPIAVVDTFGQRVGQTTETQTLTYAGFIDNNSRGRARLTAVPDLMVRAGLNVRGKSSGGFAKKQYHLETLDESNTDDDVSILGFPAESDWVLHGPYSDKSLMRNFLAYKWSNDIGRYAVRSQYVEMFLNTAGGAVSMDDYVGVYILMEKIKLSENRVNITELKPSDNIEPQITGGYIVKKDKLDSDDLTFRTSRGLNLICLEPDKDEITQLQMDWIRNYLNEFEAVLYGSDFTHPTQRYAKYIDVGSFIDHHIIVELTKNIDGFRLSTYMYKDRGGKLNMGPVWDYNLSLGNADYLDGWKPDGWYSNLLGNSDYPWWRRLFEDPSFRLRYADRWFVLRQNMFDTALLLQDIDNTVDLLDEAQVRNFNRWPVLGSRLWPNWFIADTYDEEIDWMKRWLRERLTWMDTQIGAEYAAPPPLFGKQGGHISPNDTLTITSSGRFSTLYYTLDGSDPRRVTIEPTSTTSTALVNESDTKRVFVPITPVSDSWRGDEPFDDSNWQISAGEPGGIGYEKALGYEHLISLDVADTMARTNTTCYIRVPFTLGNSLGNITFLTLKVRYDDGFVAYINGIEVARRNFTGAPDWNSSADATHSDLQAVNFESIDI